MVNDKTKLGYYEAWKIYTKQGGKLIPSEFRKKYVLSEMAIDQILNEERNEEKTSNDDNRHYLKESRIFIGFAIDELHSLEGKADKCAQKDTALAKLNEAYAAIEEIEKFIKENPEPKLNKKEVMDKITIYVESRDLKIHFPSNAGENEIFLTVMGDKVGLKGDEKFEQLFLNKISSILEEWIPENAKSEWNSMTGDYLHIAMNFTTDGSEPTSYSPPH